MENSAASSLKDFWQYVYTSDFKVPEATVDRTVKNRFFSFLHILKNKDTQETTPLISRDDTAAIDESRLEKIIAAPNWKTPCSALDKSLKHWLESEHDENSFKIILGPPFAGHENILTTWAKAHQFRIIMAPSADQILHNEVSYLEHFAKSESLWVMPCLEKLFFRHSQGLDLVRRFFDNLFTGKTGPGVIGCDTWAWSFLEYVLKLESFPLLIPQAFHAEQMTNFLADLTSGGSESITVFRQMGDGKLILVPHALADSKDSPETKQSPWMKTMAEYCRGNPGIALEYWRRSLRKISSNGENETPEKVNDDFADENALWVVPWDKLSRPGIPGTLSRDHARVLYTLLIHGGLSPKLLYCLLPYSTHESIQLLRFLQSAELIEKKFEIWQVSPFGFPAVRQCLHSEGYPTGL